MRADLLLAALAAAAASFACVTPAVDPDPPPASAPESEERFAELERENTLLREHVRALEVRERKALGGVGKPTDCNLSFPPIDALVLDVKPDLELVVLNKGEKDGVKVGFVFDLYRGATYRGLVRVTEVQAGMCVGKILSQKSPIARGDSATTSL